MTWCGAHARRRTRRGCCIQSPTDRCTSDRTARRTRHDRRTGRTRTSATCSPTDVREVTSSHCQRPRTDATGVTSSHGQRSAPKQSDDRTTHTQTIQERDVDENNRSDRAMKNLIVLFVWVFSRDMHCNLNSELFNTLILSVDRPLSGL